MPTGAPLLPVTKTGPGDKQRAYIVRQNVCLKVMLGLVIVVGGLSTALLLSTYEVRLQRRHAIEGARSHREEEHASHMRVMRLSMLLQQHLEDEVHDVAVMTTYRAWLMKAVGDYQLQVVASAEKANCSTSVRPELQALGTKFDADIERVIKRLWDEVVSEGKAAQKSLHNITHAIVSELRHDDAPAIRASTPRRTHCLGLGLKSRPDCPLSFSLVPFLILSRSRSPSRSRRQDASEQGAYERVMREAGEDPGLLGYHHHEVERLDGVHAWDHEPARDDEVAGERPHHHHRHHADADDEYPHAHGRDADYGDDGGAHHARMHDDDDEYRDDDDEEHLAGALEALLQKLQHNDSVIVVDNATLEQWDELHESAMRALSDDEQEVDLDRVNQRIAAAMNSSSALLPAYNETEWGGELEYLGAMLHKARLAPYRDELLEKLTMWQAGEVRISAPLRRIEELIDEEVLEPDVLLVNGDYEHYRYD